MSCFSTSTGKLTLLWSAAVNLQNPLPLTCFNSKSRQNPNPHCVMSSSHSFIMMAIITPHLPPMANAHACHPSEAAQVRDESNGCLQPSLVECSQCSSISTWWRRRRCCSWNHGVSTSRDGWWGRRGCSRWWVTTTWHLAAPLFSTMEDRSGLRAGPNTSVHFTFSMPHPTEAS